MDESLVQNSSLTEEQSFRVSDIPLILYTEVSSRFGVGDEVSDPHHSDPEGFWKRRNLNHEIQLVGFKGTIEAEKSHNHSYFNLWAFNPWEIKDRDERDYWRSKTILRISAGSRSGGIWAYGHGNLMVETADADLKISDVNLASPSIRFVARFAALLLFRASQIACDPRCGGERYWEVQKNPTGDFTGEDDEY